MATKAIPQWLHTKRFALLALVGANALAAGSAFCEPNATSPVPGPEAILARFATVPGLSAEFREEKRISLLRNPLVSEGSLLFAPPDHLLRTVRSPVSSSVLLDAGRLSYESSGERGSLEIASHPMLRAMSESFRLLLAGDAATLKERFDMRSQPRSDGRPGWELLLSPRSAPLKDAIQSMRLRGRDSYFSEFRVTETNGDTTTSVFSAVDLSRRFSPSEVAELFRLPTQ